MCAWVSWVQCVVAGMGQGWNVRCAALRSDKTSVEQQGLYAIALCVTAAS